MSKNPANEIETRVNRGDRIPMGIPEGTLSVPEIEGFVLYWFLDSPGRISRALSAGWEFVSPDEVQLNNRGFADDPASDGNSDLGTRVSTYGAVNEQGKTLALYLMKQRKEDWEHDEQLKRDRTDRVAEALKGQRIGVTGTEDDKHRYGSFNGNLTKRTGRF